MPSASVMTALHCPAGEAGLPGTLPASPPMESMEKGRGHTRTDSRRMAVAGRRAQTGSRSADGNATTEDSICRYCIDWSRIDKEDYLLAMERSPVKDIEIKHIRKAVLTDEIHSREVYRKGIDHSYYYEGYTAFQAGEL